MDINRLRQIYEKHGADKLIEFILHKDEMIEGLQKRLEGVSYVGSLYIGEKNYSFYVKENV